MGRVRFKSLSVASEKQPKSTSRKPDSKAFLFASEKGHVILKSLDLPSHINALNPKPKGFRV